MTKSVDNVAVALAQRESHSERAIAREQQRWLTFGDRLGSDGLFDFLWKWNCICRKKKK